MNQSFKIGKEDTSNFLKAYIGEKYGYQDPKVNISAHAGYNDIRDYEPDRVEFAITAKKDIGLGIGVSEITLKLNEKEASALVKSKLQENGVEVTKVDFEVISGDDRYGGNSRVFTGTRVSVKSLEDLNNIGKSPKKLERQ